MIEIDRIALIPSYEPDEKLINVVNNLQKENFKVIVVNDGSNEKYQKYFNKLNTKVISYKENKGKGYALKTGLKYIKKNYKDYIVVTMDSDGQHLSKDAIKLCNYAEKHPKQLVLGSRKRGKNTPLKSYLGNAITSIVYKFITKNHIYDTQTGLRAFTHNLIDYMLETKGDRFEYEMNVLLNTNKNNIKITEIPIQTIYIDGNSHTHFNPIKDSLKIYKEIFKFSLSSFASFLIDYSLYIIFTILSSNLIFSNILSRLISSYVNYNINKKIVFKSKNKSFVKYYLLVIVILMLNTLILWTLSHYINIYLAKIITELILFILSFIIQKTYIFKGSDNN